MQLPDVVKRLTQLLALAHRWLGALLCIPFMSWFLSGIVMAYVGFPGISLGERLQRAQALDATRIQLSPAQAARHFPGTPERVSVVMFAGEPTYRLERGADFMVVSAETGALLSPASEALALREAARFLAAPEPSLTRHEQIGAPDQWTPHAQANRQLPLVRVFSPDAAASELYVSLPRARVIQHTTASSRFWAWLGAIPHWWYPIALRRHAECWRLTVLIGAGAGSVVATFGLVLGIYRLRRREQGPGSRRWSPFADRWLRWHHLLGLGCGAMTLTWVWSGMLSLNPLGWSRGPEPEGEELGSFRGAPIELPALQQDARAAAMACNDELVVKSLELIRVGGQAYWLCSANWNDTRVINAMAEVARPARQLEIAALEAAGCAAANRPLWASSLLEQPDSYVYPTRSDPEVRFPLLRLQFEGGTWLYIDPASGSLVRSYDGSGRAERWLYSGLHRLDFGPLYRHRTLWAGLITLLCGLGAVFSGTGLIVAARWARGRYKRGSA